MASERQIHVGNVAIGGGAPVVVQSMTLTKTHDVEATTAQIAALASAGCELVRCAVPKIEDAEALRKIVRLSPLPVIADIHFNASLALKAIDAGVAAVRINPGNIGGPDKVALVVEAARRAGIPMRIGANSGSLPKHLDELAQRDQAEALVAAALEQVELLEKLDYYDFKISVKATHVPTMIRAYRMLAGEGAVSAPPGRDRGRDAVRRLDQERRRHGRPAHGRDRRHDPRLADRRSGQGGRGRLGDPEGARPARARPGDDRLPVVRARQRRRREARGQGRGAAPLVPAGVRGGRDGLRGERTGEAGDADFGIAGGRDVGFIYAHGRVLKKVSSDILIDELFHEIDVWIEGGMRPPEAPQDGEARRARDGRKPRLIPLD